MFAWGNCSPGFGSNKSFSATVWSHSLSAALTRDGELFLFPSLSRSRRTFFKIVQAEGRTWFYVFLFIFFLSQAVPLGYSAPLFSQNLLSQRIHYSFLLTSFSLSLFENFAIGLPLFYLLLLKDAQLRVLWQSRRWSSNDVQNKVTFLLSCCFTTYF